METKMPYVLAVIIFIVCVVGPWLNHIIWCFQEREYFLLLIGALLAPIGWIHGVLLFLGVV